MRSATKQFGPVRLPVPLALVRALSPEVRAMEATAGCVPGLTIRALATGPGSLAVKGWVA